MKSLRLPFALSLALACLFALAGVWPRPALSAATQFFVKANGSGTTCSQAAPCALQTAINQSASGDTIYAASGVYTGTSTAVAYLTEGVALLGGWDGTTTLPVVRNPRVYTSTLDGQDQRRAVYISGDITVTLDGFVVTRGRNAEGGGISIAGGATAFIRHNWIVSNTATGGWGGGLSIDSTRLTLEHNIFMSNATAYEGGGLAAAFDSVLVVKDNLFIGNLANVSGGGLRLRDVHATLINNTIARNSWEGVYATGRYTISLTVITLTNNIIASNTYGLGIAKQDSGVTPTVSTTYNDVWSNATANYAGLADPTGVNGNLSTDPRFVSGPDGDYYLRQIAAGQPADSPAVNTGSASASSLGLDTRTTRTDTFPDTSTVDMGFHYPAHDFKKTYLPVLLKTP